MSYEAYFCAAVGVPQWYGLGSSQYGQCHRNIVVPEDRRLEIVRVARETQDQVIKRLIHYFTSTHVNFAGWLLPGRRRRRRLHVSKKGMGAWGHK